MVVLVLADNLLLLYFGGEGVGLCSYLLIGFWYRDPTNGAAARKAFIVTRAGDTAFLLGLFVLYTQLGTLDMAAIEVRSAALWPAGSFWPTLTALLLLGGAVGKSAQLPLQTWLPDAMAGPTPVSALIHAATMVTAGVYLIARLHGLYVLAPDVMLLVAVIGAATLLLGGASALVQFDIKRALAWSTVSQIGYMFLALGVGAWSAAMFHFMTHAFFKALLFLAAGAVIYSLHHEHDIRRMGGLRRSLPVTFWSFVIGAASLAALPVVTAGFYSKDLILLQAWSGGAAGPWLWGAGLAGACLTAFYSFRIVVVAFLGPPQTAIERRPGPRMQAPLIVLAVLALIGGFVQTPPAFGGATLFSGLLASVLPEARHATAPAVESWLSAAAMAAALLGIAAALWVYRRRPALASPPARSWRATISRGWDFDALYGRLFVHPFSDLARINRHDVVDRAYGLLAAAVRTLHGLLSRTQTGLVRHYASALAFGAIVLVALAML
jgi:NADH-quinone oxidoreductase subunit L